MHPPSPSSMSTPLPLPAVARQSNYNRGGGGAEMGAGNCVGVVQIHASCWCMHVWPCVLARTTLTPPLPKLLSQPSSLLACTCHAPAVAAVPAGWRPASPAGSAVAAVCTAHKRSGPVLHRANLHHPTKQLRACHSGCVARGGSPESDCAPRPDV